MNIKFNNSILDNDFYKLTMHYAVDTLYPEYKVKYKMYIRNPRIEISKREFNELVEELRIYALTFKTTNSLSNNTIINKKFINSINFLPEIYWKKINRIELKDSDIVISSKYTSKNNFEITYEGLWKDLILLEVPFINIISKFFTNSKYKTIISYLSDRYIDLRIHEIMNDLEKLNHFSKKNNTIVYISEFGTRRRILPKLQSNLILSLLKANFSNIVFQGTSNVLYSIENNTVPVGTMAHEWVMFHTFLGNPISANRMALQAWDTVYNGKLGIALTDTYTSKMFFNTIEKSLAEKYDGLRHDSGNPLKFIDNAYEFYKQHKINPETKKIIFSNKVNPTIIKNILKYNIKRKYNFMYSFGIGSYFTNSLPISNSGRMEAVDVVIKLDSVNNVPVCKLSDDVGKHTGDINTILYSTHQIDRFIRGLQC